MSKKDYEALALALHSEYRSNNSAMYKAGVLGAARSMLHYMKVENPNFKPGVFLAAVETGTIVRGRK